MTYKVIEKFCQYRWDRIAMDKDGNLVYLAETAWIIKSLQADFPEIRFPCTSELKLPAVCCREFDPQGRTFILIAR